MASNTSGRALGAAAPPLHNAGGRVPGDPEVGPVDDSRPLLGQTTTSSSLYSAHVYGGADQGGGMPRLGKPPNVRLLGILAACAVIAVVAAVGGVTVHHYIQNRNAVQQAKANPAPPRAQLPSPSPSPPPPQPPKSAWTMCDAIQHWGGQAAPLTDITMISVLDGIMNKTQLAASDCFLLGASTTHDPQPALDLLLPVMRAALSTRSIYAAVSGLQGFPVKVPQLMSATTCAGMMGAVPNATLSNLDGPIVKAIFSGMSDGMRAGNLSLGEVVADVAAVIASGLDTMLAQKRVGNPLAAAYPDAFLGAASDFSAVLSKLVAQGRLAVFADYAAVALSTMAGAVAQALEGQGEPPADGNTLGGFTAAIMITELYASAGAAAQRACGGVNMTECEALAEVMEYDDLGRILEDLVSVRNLDDLKDLLGNNATLLASLVRVANAEGMALGSALYGAVVDSMLAMYTWPTTKRALALSAPTMRQGMGELMRRACDVSEGTGAPRLQLSIAVALAGVSSGLNDSQTAALQKYWAGEASLPSATIKPADVQVASMKVVADDSNTNLVVKSVMALPTVRQASVLNWRGVWRGGVAQAIQLRTVLGLPIPPPVVVGGGGGSDGGVDPFDSDDGDNGDDGDGGDGFGSGFGDDDDGDGGGDDDDDGDDDDGDDQEEYTGGVEVLLVGAVPLATAAA